MPRDSRVPKGFRTDPPADQIGALRRERALILMAVIFLVILSVILNSLLGAQGRLRGAVPILAIAIAVIALGVALALSLSVRRRTEAITLAVQSAGVDDTSVNQKRELEDASLDEIIDRLASMVNWSEACIRLLDHGPDAQEQIRSHLLRLAQSGLDAGVVIRQGVHEIDDRTASLPGSLSKNRS